MATEFASSGADKVVRDEERVEKAISRTARTAERSEGKTKKWMDRHKGALTAIGVAAGGAMAAIISQTPDLVAGLSETQLYLSMFAMEIGQTWSPALEKFNDLLSDAYDWFEKLPDPVKNLIGMVSGVGLALLVAIPTIALFVWSLSTIATALAGVAVGPFVGAMGLLTLGLAVVAGALLGGIVVWGLWKLGVLQAVEDAGARFGWFARNTLTVLGNLRDNLFEWAGLVAANAGLWGSQFALNWVDGITKNIPFLGDALAPKIDSLRSALDSAGVELQRRWDEWNTSGGFRDGLMEGVIVSTPTPNRTVSDTIGGLDSWIFGSGAGSGAGSTQEDRLAEMFAGMPDFAMPPGYDEAAEKLLDLQRQAEDLDATAAITSSNVSASMATMAGNVSTSSQSVSTTTESAAGDVATTFDALVSRSPKWGSDLMGHFVAGVNMQFPALLSTLSRIRSAIESALSFDIVANDRMAQRWGSDFVQHFNAGLASRPIELPEMPPAANSAGGSSTSTTYNTPVTVEINITGAQAQGLDERKLAAMVRDEIGQALRSRGR